MFCSHSRSCSGSSVFTGSAGSFAPSILPALGNTSSSTKIGAATRKASAMASEGRESTVYSAVPSRSEEHTSELQSQSNLVCRLLLEKKKKIKKRRQLTKQSHQTL